MQPYKFEFCESAGWTLAREQVDVDSQSGLIWIGFSILFPNISHLFWNMIKALVHMWRPDALSLK